MAALTDRCAQLTREAKRSAARCKEVFMIVYAVYVRGLLLCSCCCIYSMFSPISCVSEHTVVSNGCVVCCYVSVNCTRTVEQQIEKLQSASKPTALQVRVLVIRIAIVIFCLCFWFPVWLSICSFHFCLSDTLICVSKSL